MKRPFLHPGTGFLMTYPYTVLVVTGGYLSAPMKASVGVVLVDVGCRQSSLWIIRIQKKN
jgi:hypothetical protein